MNNSHEELVQRIERDLLDSFGRKSWNWRLKTAIRKTAPMDWAARAAPRKNRPD